MRLLFASLVILMLATPVAGHELSVYTVMVNSEGAHPADIPNGSLKEGDAAWFWMKDSTNNTTLVVQLEHEKWCGREEVRCLFPALASN